MFDFNLSKIGSSRLNKNIKENKEKLTPKADLNAMYVGIVEDTNDPRGLGRIKVRVPALHGTRGNQAYYMPTKQIPWATPALLNGGTNDMGQYIIPVKGSQVMVTFELNSFNKPVYMGTVPSNTSGNIKYYNDNDAIYKGDNVSIKDNDRIKDLNKSSSNAVGASRQTDKQKMTTGKTVIYKSLKGATVMIDDSDGVENITFMDASGQMLQLGNSSGSALPRRGSRTTPSRGASTYMSLRNGQGDAVTITKGKVNIKTGNSEQIELSNGKVKISTSSGDYLQLKDGDIILTNSNGDEITLKNGKAKITNSNGDEITLDSGKIDVKNSSGDKISIEQNKINIESGSNKIKLDGTKVEATNGTGTLSLDGSNASLTNGSGSVTIGSGGVSINNGSSTMSFSGGAAYIGGARIWDDSYHPGV